MGVAMAGAMVEAEMKEDEVPREVQAVGGTGMVAPSEAGVEGARAREDTAGWLAVKERVGPEVA